MPAPPSKPSYVDGNWAAGLTPTERLEGSSGEPSRGPASRGRHDRLSRLLERCSDLGAAVFELEPGVLARVAGTVTPQPVIAVVETPLFELTGLKATSPQLVVVCVDVRDPGNAGTVARSAWAAGADAVVCCEGTVDLWNPKAVRSSAGAVFHLPVVLAGAATEVLGEIGEWGLKRLGTVVRRGSRLCVGRPHVQRSLSFLATRPPACPSKSFAAQLDGVVSIPMAHGAESHQRGHGGRRCMFRGRPPAPLWCPGELGPAGGTVALARARQNERHVIERERFAGRANCGSEPRAAPTTWLRSEASPR